MNIFAWLLTVKVILDLNFYKIPREENLKQQWLLKIKHPVDTTCQKSHAYCFGFKHRLEKDAISAGPK